MSVRPHAPLLPIALALAGVAGIALWRWARLASLDEAAALALALALWFAARRGGIVGALALALGVIAGDWLRPWTPARVPALPGLEGASSAMVLLVLAWVLGRAARKGGDSPIGDAGPLRVGGLVGPDPVAAGAPREAGSAVARGETHPSVHGTDAQEPAQALVARAAASGNDPELVGQVAHELRTPLNAMAGWLHVLEAGAEFGEEAQLKARSGLRRAVVQQRDLVDSVDELSRATTGDLVLARGPVDLRTVLGQAIEPALTLLGDGRAPALHAPDAGPPIWVEADAERLGRVIVDLLVAVARLCPPGACLDVQTGTDGDAGAATAWIAWTVRTSDGGPDETVETLMRERVDGHTKRGRFRPPILAVRRARAIAELHGGALQRSGDATSPGVRLSLPLSALRPMAAAPAPATAGGNGLSGLRLLVVDDQEEMREMLVTLLGQQGARVSQADCAAGALALIGTAGTDRFDLAVLDVAMPGEDGLSLVRRIREAEGRDGRSRMGAIALTAHAGAALEREALASGFDAFLPKPLDPGRLVAAIRALRPAA